MDAPNSGFASLDGERPALVKPGLYDISYQGYETWMMFGRAPKLTLNFKILTMGEFFETRLQRHYNVKRLIDRPGQHGRFKVTFNCDFLLEYTTLFGMPVRLDRIAMSNFEKRIFVAKVRTVTKGAHQKDRPPGLQYSVIDEIRSIKQ